jgi:hypothetical protein
MAPILALLFLRHIFSNHEIPNDIISDCGKLFVSKFWSSLCSLLSIKSNLSTAYHPEMDGEMERVNMILEQYLCVYVNYQQDDWASLLPLAEFAYNNAPHSATGFSPFFTNKGYRPSIEISTHAVSSFAAQQYAESLSDLHDYLKEQIGVASSQYVTMMEHHQIPAPAFLISYKVWLNAKNIKTK